MTRFLGILTPQVCEADEEREVIYLNDVTKQILWKKAGNFIFTSWKLTWLEYVLGVAALPVDSRVVALLPFMMVLVGLLPFLLWLWRDWVVRTVYLLKHGFVESYRGGTRTGWRWWRQLLRAAYKVQDIKLSTVPGQVLKLVPLIYKYTPQILEGHAGFFWSSQPKKVFLKASIHFTIGKNLNYS